MPQFPRLTLDGATGIAREIEHIRMLKSPQLVHELTYSLSQWKTTLLEHECYEMLQDIKVVEESNEFVIPFLDLS